MGQYYFPIIIDKAFKPTIKRWFYSHDHKYTWQHDKKSEKHTSGCGLKLMEHSYVGNGFVGFVMAYLYLNPQRLVWAGDYADGEEGAKLDEEGDLPNLHSLAHAHEYLKSGESLDYKLPKRFKYVINHDTKQFVNLDKAPKDEHKWQVHPLPLLTCEGNGNGGGDYRKENENIGIWARHTISVDTKKPKGYTEFNPNFIMD